MTGILVASVRAGDARQVGQQLDSLEDACRKMDLTTAMQVLQSLVPEYKVSR